MKIVKLCWYQTLHYNLLPCIILLPEPFHLTIQLKFWNRHAGIKFKFINNIFKGCFT